VLKEREARGGIKQWGQTNILIDRMSRREGEERDDEVESPPVHTGDKQVGGCRCGCLSPRAVRINIPYPRVHPLPSHGA